jgi:D-sedoheptulose 7-phosphate isomerase
MVSRHTSQYIADLITIAGQLDQNAIDAMVDILVRTRTGSGRLFIVGVGGGAGNANHAVCDFRKLAGIESYSPSDNTSELTARINDNGWDSSYADWLRVSRLRAGDCLFVMSVGGGNKEKNISVNLIGAMELAKEVGASIIAVVGRDGGEAAKLADACVIVPTVNASTVTPHTESFQVAVWHLLISHPDVLVGEMKWETVTR